MNNEQTKRVDFTKPIRLIKHPHIKVEYLKHLHNNKRSVVVTAKDGELEWASNYPEAFFENIPQSEWTALRSKKGIYNTSIPTTNKSLAMKWLENSADDKVGLLETTPDGKTVLHTLEDLKNG